MAAQGHYIGRSSVSAVDHKTAVLLRYPGAAHAVSPEAGILYELACKISMGTFEGAACAGIFQGLFLPPSGCQFLHPGLNGFLVPRFQLKGCLQHLSLIHI